MKLKLCLVGGGLRGGGQERTLTNLANFSSGNGFEITVINLFRSEQFYLLDEKVTIIWPPIDRSRHHRLIYAFLILPYLRRNIKEINPAAVLCFGEWFNPFVILATRFLNIPVYAFDRMGPEMKLDPLIQFSRKVLYKYATGVVVQTAAAAQKVKEKTNATNVAVIPNALNPVNVDSKNKKKVIVSVGRLSPEKGHIILLRAFSRIEQIDWHLSIVGDGPERSALEKEAFNLGVIDRVHFLGHLKDFASILGESEIFVLPSYHEGFPNALLEAMSVPLACVSSDCVAGPSDIIVQGVNGLLVKPGDVEELAKAIELLINDPALRYSLAKEAYKVRERFDFEKIAGEYLKFIFK